MAWRGTLRPARKVTRLVDKLFFGGNGLFSSIMQDAFGPFDVIGY